MEFVHPVIVGKRALPALGVPCADVGLLARPDDVAMAFGQGAEVAAAVGAAAATGCLTVAFAPVGAEWEFEVPTTDPFVAQEQVETTYHVLWELVHVFFDHRGLLTGRAERPRHDAGASSFLYPFLGEAEDDLDAILADVAGSVRAKAAEAGALRTQTLAEGREALAAAAGALRDGFAQGGKLLALGNGGSATDAMDAVADLRRPPAPWRARPAIDLTADASILTAVANDVGVEAIFARQVIAYGHPGDALLSFSTSGGSANVIAALAEAPAPRAGHDRPRRLRRRPDRRRAPRRPRRRHAVRAHPADPGGAGQRVARPARAGRGVMDGTLRPGPASGTATRRAHVRVEGVVQGVGFRPFVHRLAAELQLAGFVRNDARGVEVEAEGPADAVGRFLERLAADAPPLARVEAVRARDVAARGGRGFAIAGSAGGAPAALVTADAATCDDCLAELFDPADRRFRYPFVNCTNCGPRFTIVRGVPYDRPRTTMAGFAMCDACRRGVRRPRATGASTPSRTPARPAGRGRGSWRDGRVQADGDAVAEAAALLRAGAVVAVKGLGGYHLACRAGRRGGGRAPARAQAPRGQAVRAHGGATSAAARALVALGDEEVALLTSPARPIVLARRHARGRRRARRRTRGARARRDAPLLAAAPPAARRRRMHRSC